MAFHAFRFGSSPLSLFLVCFVIADDEAVMALLLLLLWLLLQSYPIRCRFIFMLLFGGFPINYRSISLTPSGHKRSHSLRRGPRLLVCSLAHALHVCGLMKSVFAGIRLLDFCSNWKITFFGLTQSLVFACLR